MEMQYFTIILSLNYDRLNYPKTNICEVYNKWLSICKDS